MRLAEHCKNKNVVNNDPLRDVLQEVDGIIQVAEFMVVLSFPAPFDEDPSRKELANSCQ